MISEEEHLFETMSKPVIPELTWITYNEWMSSISSTYLPPTGKVQFYRPSPCGRDAYGFLFSYYDPTVHEIPLIWNYSIHYLSTMRDCTFHDLRLIPFSDVPSCLSPNPDAAIYLML